MSTRPRTGTSRTKSPTPPPGMRESSGTSPASSADEAYEPQATDARVERASLQRREIPSFSESREARIAEAAYWRAERRGFVAGQELDDWLAAEQEIDAQDERERSNASDQGGSREGGSGPEQADG